MKLVRSLAALDWRHGLALVSLIILAEVIVIAVVTTHERPSYASPPPAIVSAAASVTSKGTQLEISSHDFDAVIDELQVDWGDGHRTTLTEGCRAPGGGRRYGGETITATTEHPHRAERIRVRPVSRSCVQTQPLQTGDWTLAANDLPDRLGRRR